ncbi:MAG: Rpn family recombination-promoting nuclease/putative transposase [Clostridiales bacterium]|jgi:predicted transposase/invertase (TIGR01784 family)|nr:Rpn family recombination-promoting nuclease/putative transposase [Clostridiales bacterium]
MAILKNTFRTDILFKSIFVKYPDLLKGLVTKLLRIRLEDIESFDIKNTEMTPELVTSKFCHLDIHMVLNGQQINLEVQQDNEGDFPERALFHWARAYSNALPVGGKYSNLPRTIIISILNFPLFTSYPEFYSHFQALEVTSHKQLTDKLDLYFFELPNLPEGINKDDPMLLWLFLFRANTLEELLEIEALGVPEMNQAINAYHSVTTSPEFQELERMRIKASHDEAQALHNARTQEREKWQGVVAEKDAALTEKEEEIIQLRAQLAKLQEKS